MAKKKIHELPDPIGAVDLGTSYVVVDSYDAINDEYKTVKLPADEVGGETGNFVEKTGDTMTGPLVVDAIEIIDGVIPFDSGTPLSGVEYTSGTIPNDGAYTNGVNSIPMKSTDGIGQDATFVVIVQTGNIMVFAAKISGDPVQNGGRNFEIGDTIVLSGSYLGGVDGTDDMTITVTQTISENIGSVTTIGNIFETNAEVTFNNNNVHNGDILMVTGDDYVSKKISINDDFNSPGMGLTIDNVKLMYKYNNFTSTIDSDTRLLLRHNDNTNTVDISLQSYLNRIDLNTTASTLSLVFNKLPVFADNGTAIAGGLITNTVYKTATGELRIVI